MPTKLSQILEENADPKYRLSARACQGILNRAERRGKELPKELREALEAQIGQMELTEQQIASVELQLEAEIAKKKMKEKLEQYQEEKITQSVCKGTESEEAMQQDVREPDGGGGGVTLLTQPTDTQSPFRNEPENLGGQRNPYPR